LLESAILRDLRRSSGGHPIRASARLSRPAPRRGFRTFRYPDSAGDRVAETSSVSASDGVCAVSATHLAARCQLESHEAGFRPFHAWMALREIIEQGRNSAHRDFRDVGVSEVSEVCEVSAETLVAETLVTGWVCAEKAMMPILPGREAGRHKPQHCSGTSSGRESWLLHFKIRSRIRAARSLRAARVAYFWPRARSVGRTPCVGPRSPAMTAECSQPARAEKKTAGPQAPPSSRSSCVPCASGRL
jgi:hypothetical protein